MQNLEEIVNNKNINLEKMITEYNGLENADVNVSSLKIKLKSSIEKLEFMIQDIQKMKQCKTNDTFKTHLQVNKKNKKENLATNNPEIIPQKKNDNALPKRDSLPLKNQERNSILKDPEILALINKTRCRLLKKPTL